MSRPTTSNPKVPATQPVPPTTPPPAAPTAQPPGEQGGPKGPEPTRFGDWEKNGRCFDF